MVAASPVLALLAVFALPLSTHSSGALAFSTNKHRHRPAPTVVPSRHVNHVNSNADPNDGGDASPLPPPSVVCVGEALWDSLPGGMFLGGAPANVAVHVASLFRNSGDGDDDDDAARRPTVAVAACLGDDRLGGEAMRRLAARGVRVDYVQRHDEWETGVATAILDEHGDATYEFITPAAWDGLRPTDALRDLTTEPEDAATSSSSSRVFVMGTIAGRLGDEREATSSTTLSTVRDAAPEGSVVLDVNLRGPWYAPDAVLRLARGVAASGGGMSPKRLALLKMNEEELRELERWCGLEDDDDDASADERSLTGSVLARRMERLATSLNARRVCVTRGKDGAALFCGSDGDADEDEFHEHPGHGGGLVADRDGYTVGAGDAFLAALVNSLFVERETPPRALERACALGGYVASCRGATPEHDDAPEDLRRIFS